MTATEAAVGFALAAGVLSVWLCFQKGVGTARTAVGSRRLVLGAAVEVRGLDDGKIVTDPSWLSEARVSDGRHCGHGGERR